MADQGKSLGKKIWSFFVNDAETPIQAAVPGASGTGGQVQPPAAVSPGTPPSLSKGAIDDKFIRHFVALLEKQNLPGPDYFEFKEALKGLEGLELSEEKRFQAAWASFRAMSGVTDVSVLSSSASRYVDFLVSDRTAFLRDAEKAIEERVGSLNAELKKLKADNEAYANQITELQEKIRLNEARIGKISEEVTVQSGKINENKAAYELTYTSFMEQLKADIDKIQRYVK